MEITETKIELGTGRTYEWSVEEQSKMSQKKWKMQDEHGRDTQMERGGVGGGEIKMSNEGFCTLIHD